MGEPAKSCGLRVTIPCMKSVMAQAIFISTTSSSWRGTWLKPDRICSAMATSNRLWERENVAEGCAVAEFPRRRIQIVTHTRQEDDVAA